MAKATEIDKDIYSRAQDLVTEALEMLREEQERLQDYYYGKTETWQESQKGEDLQEKINLVEQAADDLENIDWSLGE